MTVAIVALGSAGLALVYSGLVDPRPRRQRGLVALLAQRYGISTRKVPGAVVGMVASAIAIGTTAAATTGLAIVGMLAGIAGATIPGTVMRRRARRRAEAWREAWPDAIAVLIAMVRSGAALPDAVSALAERGPEALRPAFDAFRARYRATASFIPSLHALADHVADPVGDKVVVTLALAYEVGGSDLVRALRTLCDFVRDDLSVRREVTARWSWTVTGARLAAAAPWIVLALMITRPEAQVAYSSGPGALVLVFGALATIIGYRLMLAAARLPEPRRLER